MVPVCIPWEVLPANGAILAEHVLGMVTTLDVANQGARRRPGRPTTMYVGM